jgi:integrase
MEKQKFNFTKHALEDLPIPSEKNRVYYGDAKTHGLFIAVMRNGRKTFYFRRKTNQISQRFIIGRFPEYSIEQARNKAIEIASLIAKGENPHEEKKVKKTELTLGESFEAYLNGHVKQHCVAVKNIEGDFRRYLSDWNHRKLSSITKAEVQNRMNKVGEENGKTAANHMLTYARAAINWCIKNELISTQNQWIGIKKYRTQARERFLSRTELLSFFSALKEFPNDTGMRDYLYISLFTGARRSNVLSMRWQDVDLDLGIWRIPRTKSGDSHTLPLPSMALVILLERSKTKSSDWVFPGPGGTGHLVEPKRSWHALLRKAELSNLRMHDLRRTLGSYMAMGNQSLQMIGKVLGHKSPTATQIYARMAFDPIREAMEKAQNDMLAAAGISEVA